MPVVIKVYCEAEAHSGIRSAVEYATQRFFALHDKTFVFQTLEVAAQMLVHSKLASPDDQEWVAKHVYLLLATLSNTSSTSAEDAAGVYNMNKPQEREALLAMVNEKPEVLLGPLARSNTLADINEPTTNLSTVLDRFQGGKFPLDDLVRLILTIVAHNTTIQRSEQFLAVLRLLCPHLYNGSMSARLVLQQGIEALSSVIFKSVNRTRGPDPNAARPSQQTHKRPLPSSLDPNHRGVRSTGKK